MPRKLALSHVPTPLTKSEALDKWFDADIWVKRDDATAGAEAGNKIRKLEYLLADALERGASTVITCGAAQSNHARATALLGASVGLGSILYLRTNDPGNPPSTEGNLLLDRMAGADLRFITPDEYRRRDELLEAAAQEEASFGRIAYAIPEGGSNGLGALGYVDAMREVREQLDLGLGGGPAPFDAIVHACGSGGTAAGIALGSGLFDVAKETIAVAVCNDRAYFEHAVARIVREARAIDPTLGEPGPLRVEDRFKGPAYGVMTDEQLHFVVEVTRRTGLVLDTVYTGKALFALAKLEPKPKRVLFIHTGGLPGLLGVPDALSRVL